MLYSHMQQVIILIGNLPGGGGGGGGLRVKYLTRIIVFKESPYFFKQYIISKDIFIASGGIIFLV